MLREKLIQALNSSEGERDVSRYIRQHAAVLLWTFVSTGGHSKYVVPEFQFGNKYRADFVIVWSCSRKFKVHFIEFEPPDDPVITRNGRPTGRLNSAISQIGDWRMFVEENHALVKNDLSDWCRKKDVLRLHSKKIPFNYSGQRLNDNDNFVMWEYHVVTGRRDKITPEMGRKINQYHHNGFVDVCSYDRLIDVASNIDDFENNPGKSICMSRVNGV